MSPNPSLLLIMMCGLFLKAIYIYSLCVCIEVPSFWLQVYHLICYNHHNMKSRAKRLFLIFHGRFPSEKAASLFAAKEGEAFGKIGLSVTVLVPRRFGRFKVEPHDYYNLENNFEVRYLPTIDILNIGFLKGLSFKLSFLTFSLVSFVYLFFKANKQDLIYSNESLPILFSTFYFPNTLYELHDFPEGKRFFYRLLFQKVKHLLITNIWKTEEVIRLFGVNREKIICERNAVEVKDFDIPVEMEEARDKLKLPKDKKVIIYTGHLYSWKGADTLAEATKMLPKDYLTVFVGGTNEDVNNFKAKYGGVEKILIVGHKERGEIPLWQKSADILVLPNTAKEGISKYYTSPMKLFEYMASKRPIVATDIPSIREIVNEENAIMVLPDDPNSLVEGIKKAINDKDLVEKITEKAYSDVLIHTWEKRAGRILDFVERK